MILSALGKEEHIWLFSRYLFYIVDTICGFLIHIIRKEQRDKQQQGNAYNTIDYDNELFFDAL